jgi:hypothetical protein
VFRFRVGAPTFGYAISGAGFASAMCSVVLQTLDYWCFLLWLVELLDDVKVAAEVDLDTSLLACAVMTGPFSAQSRSFVVVRLSYLAKMVCQRHHRGHNTARGC